MKFSGGTTEVLEKELKAAFPKDNVVVSPSAHFMRLNLSGFEVLNVSLKELAKTMEFLSDGKLMVEVTESGEGSAGNIWRIGSKLATTPATLFQLKMRSVAAPNLFRDKEKAERVKKNAEELETLRLQRILESARAGFNDIHGAARLELLPEQNIFVLVGNEDGIAGMESFIKAAEGLAADEAAKKVALGDALAPKMHAVVAPHLFAQKERLDRITEEVENVQGLWNESHEKMMQMAGIDDRRGGVCVQQRDEQKLFVLIGSEGDIAGLESLIQAAEKNAADEDAELLAATAKIEDLEQQINVAKQNLEYEKKVMFERTENLKAEQEGKTKALELQLHDTKELSPEKQAQLIAEKDASINRIEGLLAEEEAKSLSRIVQLSKVIIEARARLEAAKSKLPAKE